MNDTDFKVEAIARLAPNVGFAYNEKDGIFQWESDTAKPTKDQIEKKALEVKKEYGALQYQRDRAVAYPSIADQLDKIYHSGIDEWKKDIKVVKDKYPKPK
jgi:hypothetical protein